MKSISTYAFILLGIVLLFSNCKKDNDIMPPDEGEVTKDENVEVELPEDKGTIGFIIDVRTIALKGYQPTQAEIIFTSPYDKYSTVLDIDEITNTTTLVVDVKELTDDQVTELKNGVTTKIIIKDASGTVLTQYDKSTQQLTANEVIILETDLPTILAPFVLNSTTPYYIQRKSDGKLIVYDDTEIKLNTFQRGKGAIGISEFSGTNDQQFYFEAIPNRPNLYHIKLRATNNYLSVESSTNRFITQIDTPKGRSSEFEVRQREDGSILLRLLHYSGSTYSGSEHFLGGIMGDEKGEGVVSALNVDRKSYFNIVAADVSWDVDDLGTVRGEPLFPSAQTSFPFKQEIRNCSSASVESTIGVDQTFETKSTSSFEESIALYSSTTYSADVKVSFSIGFNIFGLGSSVDVEAGFGYENKTSVNQSVTVGQSVTELERTKVFSQRTISVSPQQSIVAYDAVQFFDDIQIPYVQKLRISGKHATDVKLIGNELLTQLSANGFNGVIQKIGDDFVEITIRGVSILENMMDVKTEIEDGTPCN